VLSRRFLIDLAWRLASLALVLGAWEIAGRIPLSYALPPFSATAAAFVVILKDGSLIAAYGVTLLPLVLGLAICVFAGVALGVAMGLWRGWEWTFSPAFTVVQAAPMAALIPLITFIYGIGLVSKVLAVCLLAAPIIVLNSYQAVRNVSPVLIDMCRSFQGTRFQQVALIILPAASPVIFAGLRLGVAAGFIGIVLAELLITPTGIGDIITYSSSIADYPTMFAVIVSIIVFAAVTVALIQRLEGAWLRPDTVVQA
jgi:NitT/TauT family transport system permease protein